MEINFTLKNTDKEFSEWIRKYYDQKVGGKKERYENLRWFSSSRHKRQYFFSKKSILFHLKDIDFSNCLEIGCGPGTWTNLLIKKYPNSKLTCLDISKEMIKQHEESIKSNNVKRIVSDFLEADLEKEKFDFIFFSRSIEYIPNKPLIIKKLY